MTPSHAPGWSQRSSQRLPSSSVAAVLATAAAVAAAAASAAPASFTSSLIWKRTKTRTIKQERLVRENVRALFGGGGGKNDVVRKMGR